MLLHDPNLLQEINKSTLILDTNVFINASKNRDFLKFVKELPSNGTALMTITSVVWEFTNGAEGNLDNYNKLVDYINGFGVVVYPKAEDSIKEDDQFNVILQKSAPKASYVDTLLCTILHKFSHVDVLLVSSNHRDIPLSIFERKHVLTLDVGRELHSMGFYSFSQDKFKTAVEKLLG